MGQNITKKTKKIEIRSKPIPNKSASHTPSHTIKKEKIIERKDKIAYQKSLKRRKAVGVGGKFNWEDDVSSGDYWALW